MSAQRRPTLLECERGAMFAEALVMFPLLIVLWIICAFLHDGNTVDNEVMEDSRYCAWRHAVDVCRGGAPRGCSLSGHSEVSGHEFDAVSGGALTTLTQKTPFLAGEWQRPHGAIFTATKRDTLPRPLGWSSIAVESHHTWMCQTEKRPWRDYSVYALMCATYGLPYCSSGSVSLPSMPAFPTGGATLPTNAAEARGRLERWRSGTFGGSSI